MGNLRLGFIRSNTLDQTVLRLFGDPHPIGLSTNPSRLALLGTATMAHLHSGIRVAAQRRGLFVSVYENDYGQYWQEPADPSSPFHRVKPAGIVPALRGHHLVARLNAGLDKGHVRSLLH